MLEYVVMNENGKQQNEPIKYILKTLINAA